MVRPKLIEAFNDIREYGVTIDKLIDLHEQIAPLVDQISGILVQAGIEHVQSIVIKPGDGAATGHRSRRTDHDAGAVPHPGGRRGRRPRWPSSIESTIESAVGQILADFVEKAADADTPDT